MKPRFDPDHAVMIEDHEAPPRADVYPDRRPAASLSQPLDVSLKLA